MTVLSFIKHDIEFSLKAALALGEIIHTVRVECPERGILCERNFFKEETAREWFDYCRCQTW